MCRGKAFNFVVFQLRPFRLEDHLAIFYEATATSRDQRTASSVIRCLRQHADRGG